MDTINTIEKKKASTISFVFLTAVILFFLPDLIISIYMVMTGCFMKNWLQKVLRAVCSFIGAFVFSCSFEKENKSLLNSLANMALFASSYNILNALRALASKILLAKTTNMFLLYSPYIVVIIIEVSMLIYCLFGCVSNCSSFKAFGKLLKAPFKFLLWFIMATAALALYQINNISATFFEKRIIFTTIMQSFVFDIIILLLSSLLITGIIRMMINYRDKKNLTQLKKYSGSFAMIFAILAVITSAADYYCNIENDSDKVLRNLAYYEHIGLDQLSLSNYDSAAYYYKKVDNHYNLYKCALSDEVEFDWKYLDYDEYDIEAQGIYFLSISDYHYDGKNYMMEKYPENINANMLVTAVATKRKKTEESFISDEIDIYSAAFLAANKTYFNKFPDVSLLNEKEKKELNETLEKYHDIDSLAEVLSIYCEYIKRAEPVDFDRMLDIAESSPENKELQYVVCKYISEALTDGWEDERLRCGNAVARMVELYEKDSETTDDMKLFIKYQAYNFYISLGQYHKAIDVLNMINTDDPELLNQIDSAKMLIYNKLDDAQNLYALSKQMLQKNNNSPIVYYYASLGAIKNGNNDEALDYYIDLCSLYEKNHYRGDELLQWEDYTFVLAEYIAMSDSDNWTDFTYKFFDNLTEKQKNRLSESPLAENYLNCLYYTFENTDKEKSLEYADRLLQTDDHFSMIHYLKGCIYYDYEQFVEAVNEFSIAEALNSQTPAISYGLANAYDANKQYKEAYEASLRCYQLINHTDHAKDWYGLGIHNTNLMNNLKRILEEGEQ